MVTFAWTYPSGCHHGQGGWSLQLSHLKKTVNFYFPVLNNMMFSSLDFRMHCFQAAIHIILFYSLVMVHFILVWSGQQSASKVEIQLIINHNLHSEIQAESLPG